MMMLDIAKKIIHESLRITQKDIVGIYTWPHTIELSTKCAVECYKVGADVLMVLKEDEAYFERHTILPLENFRVNERWVYEDLTAEIHIQGPKDPFRFQTDKEYSPHKIMNLYEREKESMYKSFEKKVRCAFVTFGNVTTQRADILGFNFEEWEKMTYETVNTPYSILTKFGDEVKEILEKGKEVRISSENGTDITFEIGDYPVHVEDGIISDENIEKGFLITHIPAGEVLVVPVDGIGEGRIIGEPFYRGRSGYRHYHSYATPYSKLANSMSITIRKGKVESLEELVTPLAGFTKLIYEESFGDKDKLGWLSIGINPIAKQGYFINGMVKGAVTIGIGVNKEIGGNNDSNLAFGATISKATIELDGKIILKEGKFIL